MIKYIFGISIGLLFVVAYLGYMINEYLNKHNKHKMIKRIGGIAEKRINKLLKKWATHNKSKFINSSLYKYGGRKIFEIDSIILTKKVLYIIEIKSIKGIVSGDAQNEWLEKSSKNNIYKINNPIIQNEKHIKHMNKILKIKLPTISLIIFSNETEHIQIDNIPMHVAIIKEYELYKKLEEIEEGLKIRIQRHLMKKISNKIISHQTNKLKDKKNHKSFTRNWS